MSTVEPDTLLGVDAPGDAELIPAVRDGDTDAYGELFARHVDKVRATARLQPTDDLTPYDPGGKAEVKGGAGGKDARPGKR